ncbi:uncharacterized protein SPSK_02865 [Sporothrix schenckii 1099-18]|uniref:Uncharacterized protein n=1 Tax=Sporothrix schenckii 1099-18 TaxID=1397361 RepID=A0A0F2MA11_SPOSC|nr:uncharacterized protein SPSK_02865 [Sporothrix schenckii 1099-18]KJR86472.1 hypothetical protein SPSK_02865 [Sporothrix schenckii 1099-18]
MARYKIAPVVEATVPAGNGRRTRDQLDWTRLRVGCGMAWSEACAEANGVAVKVRKSTSGRVDKRDEAIPDEGQSSVEHQERKREKNQRGAKS